MPRPKNRLPKLAVRRPIRRAADLVQATCLSCSWSTSGGTWRPVRRRMAEHTAKRHPKLAASR